MNKINEILNYGLLSELVYLTLESPYYQKEAGYNFEDKRVA